MGRTYYCVGLQRQRKYTPEWVIDRGLSQPVVIFSYPVHILPSAFSDVEVPVFPSRQIHEIRRPNTIPSRLSANIACIEVECEFCLTSQSDVIAKS
jgi:hypothetical protein